MTKLFQQLYFPANRPLLLLVAKFIGAFFSPRCICCWSNYRCCGLLSATASTTTDNFLMKFVAGGSKTKFPAEKKLFSFFLSFFAEKSDKAEKPRYRIKPIRAKKSLVRSCRWIEDWCGPLALKCGPFLFLHFIYLLLKYCSISMISFYNYKGW